MATYGYMRVSSRDQKEYRQADAFRRFEIPKKNIFLDKQSGKDFERQADRKKYRPAGTELSGRYGAVEPDHQKNRR